MRLVLALAPIAMAAAQGPDAREIVRRSLEANEQNWKIARNYTFLQRTEERRMDASGQTKSKEVKTYDITLLQGSPYIRLVARDDHPLPPESVWEVLEAFKHYERVRFIPTMRGDRTRARRAALSPNTASEPSRAAVCPRFGVR